MPFSCVWKSHASNRPFPSYFGPHYDSEASCKVFIMIISFHSYANKTNFHNKNSEMAYSLGTNITAKHRNVPHAAEFRSLASLNSKQC